MFLSPVDSSHVYILTVSHSVFVGPVLKPAIADPVKPTLETDDHKAKTQGISRVGERTMIFIRTTTRVGIKIIIKIITTALGQTQKCVHHQKNQL